MSREASWIAYVGPFRFPWGEPGSRRVYGVARSLAARGHNVIVASGEDAPAGLTRIEHVDGPGSISYLGLGELPSTSDHLLSKSRQVFLRWGQRTVAWLAAQATRPSHVLVYGGGAPYMIHLQRWCRDNNVPIIADVVEWYSHRQLPGGFFGPAHISAKLALRHYNARCDGIIAISSTLERIFKMRGCQVLRVPPTLDVQNLAVGTSRVVPHRRQLTLVYSGTPGKKDLLSNIIHGVLRAAGGDDDGQLGLQIIGPSPAQVHDLIGRRALPGGVQILGRIPQRDVSTVLQQADFSVLLRKPARFAEAGFPTKFVESMANATPVIANATSDIGNYLQDGAEGLICEDHSAEALTETLQRALLLGYDERRRMRDAARNRALQSFDFRNYSDELDAFLDAVAHIRVNPTRPFTRHSARR